MGFPGGPVVKNLQANAGDVRDVDSIPGLGRSPGGGNGIPLQYSCLKNPVDRGTWWAIVHRIADTTEHTTEHPYSKLYAQSWCLIGLLDLHL